MRVALLHGYSASNAGDGLLVTESIALLREALGVRTQIAATALHPLTFSGLDIVVISSKPGTVREAARYGRLLAGLNRCDLVVAVGGGYLRFGHRGEALRTAIAHGPQLLAAALTSTPTVYLSQSIGPLRATAPIVRLLLRRVNEIWLRDDRSVSEVRLPQTRRAPDLALLAKQGRPAAELPLAHTPVLSVRYVHGDLPRPVRDLRDVLGEVDGYVQSIGAGNDDVAAVAAVRPRAILTRDDLIDGPSQRRVVITVRLHAALMALRAGHLVIHLAYERKGFGAFQDLGLDEYVHNVNSFDVRTVHDQARRLLDDPAAAVDYDARVVRALDDAARARARLIGVLRDLVAARSFQSA